MTKKEYKAEITTTHADCRFYVWILEEYIGDPSNLNAIPPTLFKTPAGTKTEENIEVEKDGEVYVYVRFPENSYQPDTEFKLKIGSKTVYEDEPASNHHYPNSIIVLETEMR